MRSLISLLAAMPFIFAQTVSTPEQNDEKGVELKLAAILKLLEEIRCAVLAPIAVPAVIGVFCFMVQLYVAPLRMSTEICCFFVWGLRIIQAWQKRNCHLMSATSL